METKLILTGWRLARVLFRRDLWLSLLFLANTVLVVPPAFAQQSVVLVYSGNLDGELEPCGCSETGDMGGIKRQVAMIDQLRAADPNLFLVSSGGLLSSSHAYDKLTSEFILKGVSALGYDALGVQWSDLAYGEAFLASTPLPWVASNWKANDFQVQRVIDRGGQKLAVFSWLDPAVAPAVGVHMGGASASADVDALESKIKSAKQAGMLTLLTTTLPLKQLQQRFPLENVDIVLLQSAYEKYRDPLLLDGTLFLQPGSRGMRLARAVINFSADRKVLSFSHDIIDLPPAVKDAPRMQAWYDGYNAAVKAAYQASVEVRKAAQSGERRYVGADACKTCHLAAYDRWSLSRHAQAYDALQRVNKAFDADCIGCHTVGFNRDGGFIDAEVTTNLANVQCESCHGAGRDHVATQGKKRSENNGWEKAAICAQCHVEKHSPDFKVDAYWPKVAH